MTRFIKTRSERVKKCSYNKCTKEVIGEISISDDTFPYCKKHKQNVSNAAVWLVIGVYELADTELGKKKKK